MKIFCSSSHGYLYSKYLLSILAAVLLIVNTQVFAVSSNEVAANISDLMARINQVNQDLTAKDKQQNSLQHAIYNSNQAIIQSTHLLKQIKQKRDLDMAQLKEVASVLPEMESTTLALQQNVAATIAKLYQQITLINAESNSIMLANSTMSSKRKKVYLLALLKAEQDKYQQLANKLQQLSVINSKLNAEVAQLSKKLGDTTSYANTLNNEKQQQLTEENNLNSQISTEQKQLISLKETQAQLSRLLIAIVSTERLAAKQQTQSVQTRKINNQGPFFSRRLFKPVIANNILVPYAAIRRGIKSNGVLLDCHDNIPVFAISNGKVMYSGQLAGFGQIMVIDYGNNYMSIYGGILPHVGENSTVYAGEIVATSGNAANQPMGGVYLELRHRGTPVNPTFLIH